VISHDFAYPRVAEWRQAPDGMTAGQQTDREMRCPECATRMFSSRAAQLVDNGFFCPRCQTPMALVPGVPSSGS
jgi:hypothetical protein